MQTGSSYNGPVFHNKCISLGKGSKGSSSSSIKTARYYQDEAIQEFMGTVGNSTVPNCFLVSPTGSGKSLMIEYIAQKWIDLGYKALIVVPQNSIKDGFGSQRFSANGEIIEWIAPQNLSDRVEATVQGVVNFMNLPPGPKSKRSYVATYNALAKAVQCTSHFDKCFFVFDEAHHIASDGVDADDEINVSGSFLTSILYPHNIPHMMVTATPYRKDKKRLIPSEHLHRYKTYQREMADHIADLVHVGGLDTRVSVGHIGDLLDLELAKIKAEGRKAIISLPNVNSLHGANYAKQEDPNLVYNKYWAEEHVEGLVRKNGLTFASVATSESTDRYSTYLDECLEAVRKDLPGSFENLPDVVLVLEKFKEGTDCAVWSTVIQLGMSNSPVALRQFPGRGTRDHVCKRGMMVDFVTLIPQYEGPEELQVEHARDTLKSLLVLAFLNSRYLDNWNSIPNLPRPKTEDLEEVSPVDVISAEERSPTTQSALEVLDVVINDTLKGVPNPHQGVLLAMVQESMGCVPGVEVDPTPIECGDSQVKTPLLTSLAVPVCTDPLTDQDLQVVVQCRKALISICRAIAKNDSKGFASRLDQYYEDQGKLLLARYHYQENPSLTIKDLSGMVNLAESIIYDNFQKEDVFIVHSVKPTRRKSRKKIA